MPVNIGGHIGRSRWLSNSLSLGAGGRVRWSPSALGASLLGWWDAEDASTITTSGSAVSSWRDKVAGYDATQALGSAKPVYSATSFNNRPGVTFDGVDDELTLASVPFPTGSTACEIWLLVDQTALAADTTTRISMTYGGGSSSTARRVGRFVVSGINRAASQVGSGATAPALANENVEFSGRHVVRSVIEATTFRTDVNAIAGPPTALAPATGTTRTRIGANDSTTAGSFYKGVMSAVLVTSLLSADQASKLYTYLNARKA